MSLLALEKSYNDSAPSPLVQSHLEHITGNICKNSQSSQVPEINKMVIYLVSNSFLNIEDGRFSENHPNLLPQEDCCLNMKPLRCEGK